MVVFEVTGEASRRWRMWFGASGILDLATMSAIKKVNKLAFLNQVAPSGYVPGLGRGYVCSF